MQKALAEPLRRDVPFSRLDLGRGLGRSPRTIGVLEELRRQRQLPIATPNADASTGGSDDGLDLETEPFAEDHIGNPSHLGGAVRRMFDRDSIHRRSLEGIRPGGGLAEASFVSRDRHVAESTARSPIDWWSNRRHVRPDTLPT